MGQYPKGKRRKDNLYGLLQFDFVFNHSFGHHVISYGNARMMVRGGYHLDGAMSASGGKADVDHGRVRLMEIPGVDLQPCGGTHVGRTGEIGRLRVGKIENKGRHNRRINIHFDE